MNKRNPETNELFCLDTVTLIEKRLKVYQEKKNINTQKDSPINQIRRNVHAKGGDRDMVIEAYLEEVKNDLIQKLDRDTQSVQSDTSMVSASQTQKDYQDTQDPNHKPEGLSIEDIFEVLKSTLKNKGKEKIYSAMVPVDEAPDVDSQNEKKTVEIDFTKDKSSHDKSLKGRTKFAQKKNGGKSSTKRTADNYPRQCQAQLKALLWNPDFHYK